MQVIPEFGYEGEEGYVQLQAQLMEHAVRLKSDLVLDATFGPLFVRFDFVWFWVGVWG